MGCGRICQRHAELLGGGHIRGASLAAVCDIKEERVKKISQKFNVASYTDIKKMLQSENLDVLAILTESGLHAKNVVDLSPLVKNIIVVVNYKHKRFFANIKNNYKKVNFIYGSKTRQTSCYNGLKFLQKDPCKYVFIHDAARPFTSIELIKDLYKEILKKKTGVVPVIEISDSIKSIKNSVIMDSLDRKKIYLSQTPQIFNYQLLLEAYKLNKKKLDQFTDDAQVFSLTSNKIFTLKGSIENVKITTKKQWEIQEKILSMKYEIKVGQGFDTHKLVKGNGITLFGVKISFIHLRFLLIIMSKKFRNILLSIFNALFTKQQVF